MEEAGDASVFVHMPASENLLDFFRVDNIGFASFAKLPLVVFGSNFGGQLNAVGLGI